MVAHASLCPISPYPPQKGSLNTGECEGEPIPYFSILSHNSSSNYHSATWWYLNLYTKILCVGSIILQPNFSLIKCMVRKTTHTHKSHLISMAECASKWCSNAITDSNTHFNRFSVLLSLHSDNSSIFNHSFWSYTSEFYNRWQVCLVHLILLVISPLHFWQLSFHQISPLESKISPNPPL